RGCAVAVELPPVRDPLGCWPPLFPQTILRLRMFDLLQMEWFPAGHGAVLNADGYVELDAIVMNGKSLAAGAVSCIRNISNPVTFACSVLEKTPHMMITGRGANQFAEKLNIPQVAVEELVTDRAKAEWEQYRAPSQDCPWVHDTVGAVAIDCQGNVACATSTGGISNKMAGRVGDTPIIGSGGYADNLVGAVSATGHGESIMKVTLARLILFHMEQGKTTLTVMYVPALLKRHLYNTTMPWPTIHTLLCGLETFNPVRKTDRHHMKYITNPLLL
uniref:Isoaspartyl peptidase/L-asparaginase n=1 Tax=Sphenodon punctatus TaxID=8508 RepID=A0A8D0GFH9_SPHPU